MELFEFAQMFTIVAYPTLNETVSITQI